MASSKKGQWPSDDSAELESGDVESFADSESGGSVIQPATPGRVQVDSEAAGILDLSFRLGAAGHADEYHSYSSLLVASMLARNPASRWFRQRLAELSVQPSAQVEKLGIGIDLNREDAMPGLQLLQLSPKSLDWTGSARQWFDKAAGFATDRIISEDRLVSARDLIAAFVFSGSFHEQDRAAMGLGPTSGSDDAPGVALANGFMSYILNQHGSEYDFWSGVFRDEIGSDPKPDVLEGPVTRLNSDRWTVVDRLGFRGYARAIRYFLMHEQTRPPISISIQGPWGSGKTSLMRMIQHELDPEAIEAALAGGWSSYWKDSSDRSVNIGQFMELFGSDTWPEGSFRGTRPARFTVWFNAWKYESSDQLWAGLATAIIDQLTARMEPLHREQYLLRLQAARIDPAKVRQQVHELAFGNLMQGLRNHWIWLRSSIPILLGLGAETFVTGATPVGVVGSLLWAGAEIFRAFGQARKEAEETSVTLTLGDIISVPDYSANLGFTHKVVEDLKRIFDTLRISGDDGDSSIPPLVIFVDDLDRCSPKKVADVIEGVNMFLAGDFMPCVFVIGMDPQMVSAALEKAHEDITAQLPRYDRRTPLGWRFMDKFVQLPFTIPPPDREAIDEFRDFLLHGSEAEEIVSQGEEAFDAPEEPIISAKDAAERADSIALKIGEERNADQPVIRAAARLLRSTFALRLQDRISRQTSDANPMVTEMLHQAAREYSNNPRDTKRLMNVVRLQYFISRFRVASDKPIPDAAVLGRWVAFSLRWPAFVRWLQWSSPVHEDHPEAGEATQTTVSADVVKSRLELLETLSRLDIPFSEWQKRVREELSLSEGDVQWDSDPLLREFLGEESAVPLSLGAGRGFY